jgi:hypothetical protein
MIQPWVSEPARVKFLTDLWQHTVMIPKGM